MLAYDGVEIDRVEPDLGRALDDFLASPAPAARREDHRLLGRRDAPHARPPRTLGSGMTLTIAALLPGLQNTNGDAENAAVLARRAGVGRPRRRVVVRVDSRDDLPERVDAVVLGSGSDASLEASRDALLTHARRAPHLGHRGRAHPRGRHRLGAAELGHRAAPTARASRGSASSRAVRCRAAGRVTGDLVVASPRFGLLVGFENHARDYVGRRGLAARPRARRAAATAATPARRAW